MLDNYLAIAEGDTVAAVTAMETDILLMSDEMIHFKRDLSVAEARVTRYSSWYANERGNWFERLWESEAIKTMIAIAFFYLGTQAESW